MKHFILIIVFVVAPIKLFAQISDIKINDSNVYKIDTLKFSSIFSENFTERSFDYELINKYNNLKRWSRDFLMIGLLSSACILLINGELATAYNWSLWIDVPCATCVMMAILIPCCLWSRQLNKRAEAIESEISYAFKVSNNIELGLAQYANHIQNDRLYGVGLKISF